MGNILRFEDKRVCTPDHPMPVGTTAKWKHPSRYITGVSNDKALAYFVCDICQHDFLDVNPFTEDSTASADESYKLM